MLRPKKPASPFRYFSSSPEIIQLMVMVYVRLPLSLRNVEDLLAERGIDICHETVRYWRNRLGPLFAADVRRQRLALAFRSDDWLGSTIGRSECLNAHWFLSLQDACEKLEA